jgi:hypothetical protein
MLQVFLTHSMAYHDIFVLPVDSQDSDGKLPDASLDLSYRQVSVTAAGVFPLRAQSYLTLR